MSDVVTLVLGIVGYGLFLMLVASLAWNVAGYFITRGAKRREHERETADFKRRLDALNEELPSASR